ncbi:TBC-domain-containing protein [Gigaspora margarita]|uniref:TBC-domain-containing protein n=1 Tax=Gigaspora margarita TaxID=4874 RepID=A0A8H4EM10_GIGMA|nr:TBC-domain-containing protein [Gigaspora margarita]
MNNSHIDPPRGVFTLPITCDSSNPFWDVIKSSKYFILQRTRSPSSAILRGVIGTIQNVFDTKAPPFRILFRSELGSPSLQIAVSQSQKGIEDAWKWIEYSLNDGLSRLDTAAEKENYVVTKINSLVTRHDKGTDEVAEDQNIRNASRAFRQNFDIAPTERLVNFYSCAYRGIQQGWMYISENYLGFYSLILGIETKLLIELKNIENLVKEKSKRGMVSDSIKVITKDGNEYFFANLFHRDETYGLLVQLAGQSMQRLLKNAAVELTPSMPIYDADNVTDNQKLDSPSLSDPPLSPMIPSLKKGLEEQKRDIEFRILYNLPSTEHLMQECACEFSISEMKDSWTGKLQLSEAYLAFESTDGKGCSLVIPLYTVRRVERVNNKSHNLVLSVLNWHQMKSIFQFNATKSVCEKFCNTLRSNLKSQLRHMKSLRPFLSTCFSEVLLIDPKKELTVGGLGLNFGFPGDAKILRDRSKTKLWIDYMCNNGRNLTLIKSPYFYKLVRIGLPNKLRGEMWELCSGAIYLRFVNNGLYDKLHKEYAGKVTPSTEEIEKDLNRSLPEYPAYQSPEGINRLRRVLTAYSWKDPELGYCQAMNIVASAILIYMSEEQATSMYGAILDQLIFEHYVQSKMSILYDHFQKVDIQLSVACLPWFLSLYINSMPLILAFRVLDCFFMEGPKVLFQIGLAILKINGNELMEVSDDGAFINTLKKYFSSLDEPINADTSDQKTQELTKFDQLMIVAFKEFSSVTTQSVMELRNTFQLKVVHNIESFTKRDIIRNLQDTSKFSKEDISVIYDKYYTAQFYGKQKSVRNDSRMDLTTFYRFLGNITNWAKLEDDELSNSENGEPRDSQGRRIVGYKIINRLFDYFDKSSSGGITLQDVVTGLGEIKFGDMMSRIKLFFDLHDGDQDGYLLKEEMLQLSESLLFIFRFRQDDGHLSSVSNFIKNAFEYSDPSTESKALQEVVESVIDAKRKSPEDGERQMSFPSFRMVILADGYLENFFDNDFSSTFQLVEPVEERQKGLGREIFNVLMSDGMKLANRFGKRLNSRRKLQSPSQAERKKSQSSSSTSDNLKSSSTSIKSDTSESIPLVEDESIESFVSIESSEVPRNASSSSISTDEEDDGLLQEVDRLLSEYSINESESNLEDENSINYDDVDFIEDDVDKLLEEMQ